MVNSIDKESMSKKAVHSLVIYGKKGHAKREERNGGNHDERSDEYKIWRNSH